MNMKTLVEPCIAGLHLRALMADCNNELAELPLTNSWCRVVDAMFLIKLVEGRERDNITLQSKELVNARKNATLVKLTLFISRYLLCYRW